MREAMSKMIVMGDDESTEAIRARSRAIELKAVTCELRLGDS